MERTATAAHRQTYLDRFQETSSLMKLDLAHAEPMGTLIDDGTHAPFRALACPLVPRKAREDHGLISLYKQK
ncbi:hypothetical protein SynA15127_02429 [Synechococcus sp. A15-127]|nr:hypothetical protein SynA15127_02429 [Synechococcus sp. A15-127]